jgi:hypothetical protein
VPWLSDAIWRAWNEGDADARNVKLRGKPISDARPTAVTEDDRCRAARRAPPGAAPNTALPPRGTLAQHGALLESTPGLGYLAAVQWPVCCERLTTLISENGSLDLAALESASGSLNFVLTEAHLPSGSSNEQRFAREGAWVRTLAEMRAGEHAGDGTALFECRDCGRIYGAYCHP